jgi:lysyl-tRNA synthetase class 2
MPSSVIRAYRYNPESRDLLVVFQTGKRYVYRKVPPETHEALKAAFSKGYFFNRHIRDHFRYERLD